MSKTILCHCEDVDVEELYSAIEQGYGDIETLKRYTGIATGKCQGKCCLVQTLRLMAARALNPTGNAGLTAAAHGVAEPAPPDSHAGPPRLPTIRQPVLPVRIEDIPGACGDEE